MQSDAQEPLDHMLYPAADPKTAEACAWVFADAKTFQKYYFNLPELGPKEVRGRVLYSSLCFSDSHHGRGEWGGCNYPACTGKCPFPYLIHYYLIRP